MKRLFLLTIIVVIGIILVVTFNSRDTETEKVTKQEAEKDIEMVVEESKEEETALTEEEVVAEFIENLTIEEKIGQLFIGGFTGTTLTDETKELIQTYKLGGFILFKPNLENAEQSVALLNDLKHENEKNNIPLFLSVDQEGGKVTRLPGIDSLMTNEAIGKMNDETFSLKTGELLGRQLRAHGFQLNFAPVLDVNSNPNNPVIGDRSFGDDSALVSSLGVQMMKGMQAEEVIPVIKHFPGHGDTHIDSHEALPVINKSMEELEALELIPFKDAIAAGADVIMTAHILLPELGTDLPATMSKEVINDLLRSQLGFDGVVITDDMTMGAIANNYGLPEAAVLAIKSGVDIVLVAHEYENIVATFNHVKESVQSGAIKEDRIDESVKRTLLLKNKYELTNEQITEINVNSLNEEIADLYSE